MSASFDFILKIDYIILINVINIICKINTYVFTCMYAYYGYRFVHVHTCTRARTCFPLASAFVFSLPVEKWVEAAGQLLRLLLSGWLQRPLPRSLPLPVPLILHSLQVSATSHQTFYKQIPRALRP